MNDEEQHKNDAYLLEYLERLGITQIGKRRLGVNGSRRTKEDPVRRRKRKIAKRSKRRNRRQ